MMSLRVNQGEPGESIGIGGLIQGPRGDPGPAGRPGVAVCSTESFCNLLF